MLSIKKILVPTDFSTCAGDALRMGIELARKFGASVTVLHVYQIPMYPLAEGTYIAGPQITAELVRDITESLEKVKNEFKGDVPIDTRMAEGVPYVEIAHTARDGHYDLIVIGTHGRTGVRHMLLGSVAERVVRTAPCPVLTTRGTSHHVEAQPSA
jgi:nucleotide-binding universal stress UspA family protein